MKNSGHTDILNVPNGAFLVSHQFLVRLEQYFTHVWYNCVHTRVKIARNDPYPFSEVIRTFSDPTANKSVTDSYVSAQILWLLRIKNKKKSLKSDWRKWILFEFSFAKFEILNLANNINSHFAITRTAENMCTYYLLVL